MIGSTTESTSYYFVNSELVAKKNNDGSKYFYHNDHLGSTSVLTDINGNVVEATRYDPWGEINTGGTKSKFLYTGQEKDAETGLNYYNFRYYDSHIRRFTQPDDIIQDVFDPQSLNRYSYVLNNPLKYKDPTGHNPLVFAVVVSDGIIGGLAIGGFVEGVMNSQETSFWGKVSDGFHGSEKALDNPIGQRAIAIATLAPLLGDIRSGNTETSQIDNNINSKITNKTTSLRGSNNPITKTLASYGREMHKKATYEPGMIKELKMGNIRLDAGDRDIKKFVEYKPDTISGITKGLKQITAYENYIFNNYGERWSGSLRTYKSPIETLKPFFGK